MFRVLRAFFRHYRQLVVIGSLVFASLVCVGLFALRVGYTRQIYHPGLLWNLFLAWMPAFSALIAYNVTKQNSWLTWLVAPVSVFAWLIFLPNAPYLVTDLIHLRPHPAAPFWFDIILFASFAWTGTFLGLVSLFLMQEMVRRAAGGVVSWLFVFGVTALSSFGIYLGRFLRWNSWDLIVNPGQVLMDVVGVVRHPLANSQSYAFSALFAFFFLSMYLMMVAVTHLRSEPSRGWLAEQEAAFGLAETARRRRSG